MKINIFILSLLFLCMAGCSDKPENKTEPSLPTRGKLVLGVDESLRPVVDSELKIFSYLYPDAEITPVYLPEKEIAEKLLANELQTGLICRNLYKDEMEFIKIKYQHNPQTFKLAEDEIVAAVNTSNPLNNISYNDLKDILSGKITDWRQLYPALKDESPIIVVITGSSSINRFFSSVSNSLSATSVYALDTTTDVIDYVRDNPSSVGIVGGSWFYKTGSSYPNVKLLSYAGDNGSTEDLNQYPVREVYAVTHEPFVGLGTGFISFVASQKGQMVLEKAGMTPYKPITREISIKRSIPE